jgi:hypothetical protein
MNIPSEQPASREGDWAQPVDRLKVGGVQAGGVNLNVEGRKVTGPVQGFGQMWQKTYTIRLAGSPVTPQALIRGWKENFASFWPKGNRFYGQLTVNDSPLAGDTGQAPGIAPGQVALLNLAGPGGMTIPGGGPVISTGIMVVYADDESFSFMTPEGHMFAAMITFSAERHGSDTIAQIQALVRASDPLYELTFRLGIGHKMEDDFWMQTLRNLAAHFGAAGSEPELRKVLVDPRLQWSEAKNIWQNAAIRTTFYTLAAPLRWFGRVIKK